ncbi:MAG: hypothetical protein E7006_02965 [Alphaproteobacteria bacterium]|nr:hypothetical protein [Alphaproteobacteria bacterium]
MKKILVFIANLLFCIGVADAAVRDGTAISREKSGGQVVQSRVATSAPRTNVRTGNLMPRSASSVARSVSGKQVATRGAVTQKQRSVAGNVNAVRTGQVVARATSVDAGALISETRTGAEYERCKNAYFSCMDQFCSLKNDDYRRCSCNDRVFELTQQRETLQGAGEDLTVFNENLDVVGMTAAQATAMRTESEGEHALTSDNSASKALLQAIMNSIRGTDATVGGKYTDLNSVNISFDTANAFGMTDIGQAIGAYNGQALYSAVYPQCRQAVRNDCTDASLQRAVTAYLMAVEQDCNTVQSAIADTQKQMKAAVRESNAMLDLARIENRKKHNSSDITTCINEVETAVLSEEVCGANYHKCLDNGEYIDITTGQPIAGVSDFYKLQQMLSFSAGVEMANQKLSKITDNRVFVQNFENRVKKFAQPALDKCVEKADVVWSEYLDKAMLAIYYSQQAKVSEIKQLCFDYVSSCYMNTEDAVDVAMKDLDSDDTVVLQPNKIALNSRMCSDYIDACNNMFKQETGQDIIAEYIDQVQQEDTLTACRAVVQQCFDKYGGTNYENFYYPYSGLFDKGMAPDWFSLYEITGFESDNTPIKDYKSECAKRLTTIDACNDPDIIEQAFGGFDRIDNVCYETNSNGYQLFYVPKNKCECDDGKECLSAYGIITDTAPVKVQHRALRPTGVATEVYNRVLSGLVTQCTNLYGRFVPRQLVSPLVYDTTSNSCKMIWEKGNDSSMAALIINSYSIGYEEDMCPRDYADSVDTLSWGMCSCWENGARRSKWGTSVRCQAVLPTTEQSKDAVCVDTYSNPAEDSEGRIMDKYSEDQWCTQTPELISSNGSVCPLKDKSENESGNETENETENKSVKDEDGNCVIGGTVLSLPYGIDSQE